MHTARPARRKRKALNSIYHQHESPKLHLDAQSRTSESACTRMVEGGGGTGCGVAEGSSVEGIAEEDGNGARVDGNAEAGGNGANVDDKAEAGGSDAVG